MKTETSYKSDLTPSQSAAITIAVILLFVLMGLAG